MPSNEHYKKSKKLAYAYWLPIKREHSSRVRSVQTTMCGIMFLSAGTPDV